LNRDDKVSRTLHAIFSVLLMVTPGMLVDRKLLEQFPWLTVNYGEKGRPLCLGVIRDKLLFAYVFGYLGILARYLS
jgi:hypothetical protein